MRELNGITRARRSSLLNGPGLEGGETPSHYMGKTLILCTIGCKQAFEKNPHKYMEMDGRLDKTDTGAFLA